MMEILGGAVVNGQPTRYVLRFLSPYSPMFNPCEESFSSLKAHIRHALDGDLHERVLAVHHAPWGQQGVQREQILADAIDGAVPFLTPAMIQAFDRHSLSFIPAALAQEDL
jgi:hypothetical protein